MKPKSISRYFGFQPSSSLALITVCALGTAGLANAQTWTNTTTGTSNWSTTSNWDTAVAPASSATTALQFFATPSTAIPAAIAIVANQNIATPFLLNSLVVNGTGPATGTTPTLTISGGTLQFSGTSPSININPNFGGSGYTVNLTAPLNFDTATSINFGSGGGSINTGGAWNGSGTVTFTGSLGNRPLSLTNATGTTFTGDLFLTGNSNTVLQLNAVTGALGANTANTQAVVVNNNAGVNINYGNAAFNNQQNFVISGNGNASTANAAVNISRINFGNCTIGGLAVAADSTFRISMENASDARVVSASRGIVGSGKLIKTGNGYLQPSVTSPTTPVTWGGTAYSAFSGDVEVRQGVLQTTANQPNALGPNTATTQRVTISSGAAFSFSAGNNASTQPQNFILNGSGTGYAANNGGLAALDSFGAGFGNNTLRTIVLASDSSVSVRRDSSSNGPQFGLNVTSGLAGTGNLTVGSNYGQPISPLYVPVASTGFAEFPVFSGKVIINNGIMNIGNVNSLGTSTTGQVTLSGLGTLSSSIVGGLDQAFFDRIANLPTTSGTIALGVASANNLDFTTAPNARLGAIASFTYSGTITPAGSTYRLGGGGGTLTVSSALTAGHALVITGGVILSNSANDFTGGITIAGNNTGTGQGASLGFTGGTGSLPANPISFGGTGGTLAFTGAPGGTVQSLGALALSSGHATISSTYGTSGNTAISYTSLTRSAGSTGNFVTANSSSGVTANATTDTITAAASAVMANGSIVTLGGTAPAGLTAGTQYFVVNASGNTYQLATTLGGLPIDFTSAGTNVTQTVTGINGTLNKISIAGLPTGFVSKGVFFGDSNYAYNDAAGFLRAPAYGTDAGFVTSGATTSVASATHQNISGSLSAQNTATFTTFKIAGAFNVALATDQVMTVDGILKTGGNAGTISGAGTLAGIKAPTGSEMVIRPSASGDALTISTPILDNNASSLTKSGAGTLTLTAANTYTGVTTVAAGTLTVSGSGSLEDTSPVTVTGGTYNVSASDTVGAVTLKNGVIGGSTILTGTSYDVENGTISARLAGSAALVKSTSGQVILSGVNTYDGGTTITGGTLAVTGVGRLSDFGTISISGGASYELGGPDTVGDLTLIDGTIRGPGALNASFYDVRNGRIDAPLTGSGTFTKSTAGTVTLTGLNTLVAEIAVDAGTLVLADNARLKFVVSEASITNSISGTGTVNLDGDFEIDLTSGNPDLTGGNEWVLVNPALSESYGTNFSVVGFTAEPDGVTWTKTIEANEWTFSETTGKLSLGSEGYTSWATTNNVTEGETGDDDKDGISNLAEYALGLDPKLSNPTPGTFVGNLLTFTKGTEANAADDVTYAIETSTSLQADSWTSAVVATPEESTISYQLPANQPGGKLFARLKVTRP